MSNQDEINLYQLITFILFAGLGGIAKEIHSWDRKERLSVFAMIAGGVVSIFAGMVIYFGCMYFNFPISLTGFLTSLGGFIGGDVLTFIWELVKKVANKKADVDINNIKTGFIENKKKVESIRLLSDRAKKEYKVGEDLDLEYLRLEVTYEDNTMEYVKVGPKMVVGFDSSSPDDRQRLTVVYQEKQYPFVINIS